MALRDELKSPQADSAVDDTAEFDFLNQEGDGVRLLPDISAGLELANLRQALEYMLHSYIHDMEKQRWFSEDSSFLNVRCTQVNVITVFLRVLTEVINQKKSVAEFEQLCNKLLKDAQSNRENFTTEWKTYLVNAAKIGVSLLSATASVSVKAAETLATLHSARDTATPFVRAFPAESQQAALKQAEERFVQSSALGQIVRITCLVLKEYDEKGEEKATVTIDEIRKSVSQDTGYLFGLMFGKTEAYRTKFAKFAGYMSSFITVLKVARGPQKLALAPHVVGSGQAVEFKRPLQPFVTTVPLIAEDPRLSGLRAEFEVKLAAEKKALEEKLAAEKQALEQAFNLRLQAIEQEQKRAQGERERKDKIAEQPKATVPCSSTDKIGENEQKIAVLEKTVKAQGQQLAEVSQSYAETQITLSFSQRRSELDQQFTAIDQKYSTRRWTAGGVVCFAGAMGSYGASYCGIAFPAALSCGPVGWSLVGLVFAGGAFVSFAAYIYGKWNEPSLEKLDEAELIQPNFDESNNLTWLTDVHIKALEKSFLPVENKRQQQAPSAFSVSPKVNGTADRNTHEVKDDMNGVSVEVSIQSSKKKLDKGDYLEVKKCFAEIYFLIENLRKINSSRTQQCAGIVRDLVYDFQDANKPALKSITDFKRELNVRLERLLAEEQGRGPGLGFFPCEKDYKLIIALKACLQSESFKQNLTARAHARH